MTLVAASAVSEDRDLDAAADAAVQEIEGALDASSVELALVFATHHHGGATRRAGELVSRAFGGAKVAGCTGGWALGHSASEAMELEGRAGIAILALGGSGLSARVERIAPDAGPPALDDPSRAGLLVFGDPFSFPAQTWLPQVAAEYPELVVVGGLASGGQAPGQNLLLHADGAEGSGALVVVIEGDVELRPVVSQGCRPVGEPLVVTKCDGHVIRELKGKPASKVLVEAMNALPDEERGRFQRGAFLGRAVDASLSTFTSQDLLVRNLLGIDPQRNAVVVGDDALRPGQTVHLMVRDAATASRELEAVTRDAARELGDRSRAALLVTCGGRGRHMFEEENPDATRLASAFDGALPFAGFSANGEIGPVGGVPFLHGFTACAALFAERA